jgi:hypothetical protein
MAAMDFTGPHEGRQTHQAAKGNIIWPKLVPAPALQSVDLQINQIDDLEI